MWYASADSAEIALTLCIFYAASGAACKKDTNNWGQKKGLKS